MYMSDEGIWSELGNSLFLPSTLVKRIEELEQEVERLASIVRILDDELNSAEGIDPFDSRQYVNIDDFITPDENVETEDIEIRVITEGFTAPSPDAEKVSIEETAYHKWKAKEIPWTEYVRICQGVKRASAIRDKIEKSAEEE